MEKNTFIPLNDLVIHTVHTSLHQSSFSALKVVSSYTIGILMRAPSSFTVAG